MDILICHTQQDFRAKLKRDLQNAFQRLRLTIDQASNEASALEKIGSRKDRGYDFLIANLDLAPNPELPVDRAHRGLAIVKKVNDLRAKTRCLVLVTGEVLPEMADLFTSVSCALLPAGMEMFDNIIETIRSTLSKSRARPRLSLKLVQDPNSSNWNFWLGGDASFGLQEHRGAFPIQDRHIDSLSTRSKHILDRVDWLIQLGELGQDLYAHFFDQENSFSKLFRKALASAGGIDGVRFSFDIRQDYYSLAIEAIVPPEKKSAGAKKPIPPGKLPFWMLKAPIYRTLSLQNPSCTLGEEPRPCLFNGENEPINCLIIEADAAGEARLPGTRERVSFNPLLCVPEECETLEATLLENAARWKIGKVRRIWPSRSRRSFKERLFELLASGQWHVVHFCGHSYYRAGANQRPGTGYLMLPGRPIEAIDAREFAHYLGKTQFLFLSSCEGSQEAFAFEMARNRMPAVLGFRGGVDDRHVPLFVDTFYKRLFSSRSIESAFVATRRKMWKRPGVDNPLWASPILVLLHPDEAKQKPAAAAAAAAS